ncbi:MAG: hypothetical protein PVJ39_21760 [Gammaproteobacteria bacterium]|jgi:hypothetical protein
MLIRKALECRRPPGIALVVAVITSITVVLLLSACATTALTKSQMNALHEHVDLVADAIHLTVVRSQKPLLDYHVKHGQWPVEGHAKQAFVAATGASLARHGVKRMTLVKIDDQDVVIEYFFSRTRALHIPPLIESWVIVFSNRNSAKLEVVSVFPNWCDPAELARETPYDAGLITRLQRKFRGQLSDKLKYYNIKLNETINEPV